MHLNQVLVSFAFVGALLIVVMFSFVNISQVIGWEGWMVFCVSQEIGWEDGLWNNIYIVNTLCPKKTGHAYYGQYFLTNIDQYQCHLVELFLQRYLIIYHKNYSHNRVPAATVATATNALSQTKACADSANSYNCPSCTCHRRVFAPGHSWSHFSRPLAT